MRTKDKDVIEKINDYMGLLVKDKALHELVELFSKNGDEFQEKMPEIFDEINKILEQVLYAEIGCKK